MNTDRPYMKRVIKDLDDIFGMANLVPRRTGLGADIWSEHKGIIRNVSHNIPRVKITYQGQEISVTIEENPQILAPKNLKQVSKPFKSAMQYIGRNYDLFIKHFYDVSNDFDDEDLFNALRDRGEYR